MYMSFCILYSVFCSVCCEFYVHLLPGPIAPQGDFKIVVGGVGGGGVGTPVTLLVGGG